MIPERCDGVLGEDLGHGPKKGSEVRTKKDFPGETHRKGKGGK